MHFHGFHSAGMDGVFELVGRGEIIRLRVHRRTLRPAPLPLPHPAAEAPHPQGSLRSVPDRPSRRPSPCQRDGDGDERLRHQLRLRKRDLRGQHRRPPLHEAPDQVKQNELVRVYLVNITEFDLVNSFHTHATFFNEYRTGPSWSRTTSPTRSSWDRVSGRSSSSPTSSRATTCSTPTSASSPSSAGAECSGWRRDHHRTAPRHRDSDRGPGRRHLEAGRR